MAYYTPSGESEAVTVRPSATSLFAFDSDDRYADYNQRRVSPSYPFRVLIQKREALLTGFFKRIGLTEFRLNWTLPNVSRGWGTNLINFIYAGASSVTAASGSGTIQTYTAGNSFQAGQTVSVTGMTPTGYNVTNATILTANATTFTVEGTTTGASSGTGTATIGFTASVTAATATTTSGITSITYTASNNYVAGQLLRQVTGLSPSGFNVTNLRITSASPTQFVVALPAGTSLSGSSTGTGTALVGLTRQIVFDDGFYDTLAIAEYLTQNIQSVMPGFQAFVNDLNDDQIACLPPIDSGLTTYQFYFDPVTNPVVYGSLVTAASGSGTVVTYTCASASSAFTVGQSVTVTGLNTTTGASLNLTGTIATVSTTDFTINNTTVGTSTATQAGTATADAKGTFPNTNPIYRQLFDMINFPYAKQYYSFANNTLLSGIPNMRATDYIDVVCNQLTLNQNLRDSNTLPVTRDSMCRLYLDESTPSQSNVVTTTFGTSSPTTLTITGLTSITSNVAVFVSSTAVTASLLGVACIVTGVSGGLGWNGQGVISSVDTNTPFALAVTYDDAPSGTPAFSGSSVVAYTSGNTTSRPQTVWDSRMNGVTPFCLYRQFQNPKQVRWSGRMPLSNVVFELFDDNGRSLQDLWESAFPISASGGVGQYATNFANSFIWNCSCLLSED